MLPNGWGFFAHGRQPARVPPIASASFAYSSERDGVGTSLVVRILAGALAFLAAITMALTPVPATAVELPPAGNQFWIQTNGPNSLVTLGDWYTSNVPGGGGGYHYVQFQVPCGWPAGLPIFVDLFSPEENQVAGATPNTKSRTAPMTRPSSSCTGRARRWDPGMPTRLPAPASREPG